jgi:hypothetical protein
MFSISAQNYNEQIIPVKIAIPPKNDVLPLCEDLSPAQFNTFNFLANI